MLSHLENTLSAESTAKSSLTPSEVQQHFQTLIIESINITIATEIYKNYVRIYKLTKKFEKDARETKTQLNVLSRSATSSLLRSDAFNMLKIKTSNPFTED